MNDGQKQPSVKDQVAQPSDLILNINRNPEEDLIVDVDDVICPMTARWYFLFFREKPNALGPEVLEQVKRRWHMRHVYLRDNYYLGRWLADISGIEFRTEIDDILLEFYKQKGKEIYEASGYLRPTSIVKWIGVSALAMRIPRIILCTHSFEENKRDKDEWLHRIAIPEIRIAGSGLPKTKIEVLHVDPGTKKSDALKKINAIPGNFVDDNPRNIEEMISAFPNCMCYSPFLGYNCIQEFLGPKTYAAAQLGRFKYLRGISFLNNWTDELENEKEDPR